MSGSGNRHVVPTLLISLIVPFASLFSMVSVDIELVATALYDAWGTMFTVYSGQFRGKDPDHHTPSRRGLESFVGETIHCYDHLVPGDAFTEVATKLAELKTRNDLEGEALRLFNALQERVVGVKNFLERRR